MKPAMAAAHRQAELTASCVAAELTWSSSARTFSVITAANRVTLPRNALLMLRIRISLPYSLSTDLRVFSITTASLSTASMSCRGICQPR